MDVILVHIFPTWYGSSHHHKANILSKSTILLALGLKIFYLQNAKWSPIVFLIQVVVEYTMSEAQVNFKHNTN
jgi:hypothetical protein